MPVAAWRGQAPVLTINAYLFATSTVNTSIADWNESLTIEAHKLDRRAISFIKRTKTGKTKTTEALRRVPKARHWHISTSITHSILRLQNGDYTPTQP